MSAPVVCLSLYLKYYPFHGYFAIFQMKIKKVLQQVLPFEKLGKVNMGMQEETRMKRIGMLTSGGDCQALNAAMRGVVKG